MQSVRSQEWGILHTCFVVMVSLQGIVLLWGLQAVKHQMWTWRHTPKLSQHIARFFHVLCAIQLLCTNEPQTWDCQADIGKGAREQGPWRFACFHLIRGYCHDPVLTTVEVEPRFWITKLAPNICFWVPNLSHKSYCLAEGIRGEKDVFESSIFYFWVPHDPHIPAPMKIPPWVIDGPFGQ